MIKPVILNRQKAEKLLRNKCRHSNYAALYRLTESGQHVISSCIDTYIYHQAVYMHGHYVYFNRRYFTEYEWKLFLYENINIL